MHFVLYIGMRRLIDLVDIYMEIATVLMQKACMVLFWEINGPYLTFSFSNKQERRLEDFA